jgi:sulfate adenylyltransferase
MSIMSLLVAPAHAEALKRESAHYPLLMLNQRQLCDLELLMSGALTPLQGFMNQQDYISVVNNQRLAGGQLWTIPITLDVSKAWLESLKDQQRIGLCDKEGFMLAVMDIESVWQADKQTEALQVYGTQDADHPGVSYVFNQTESYYIGGKVQGIQLPIHYDFESLRNTPERLRTIFQQKGWNKILGFHTSKPMHRVQHDITCMAACSVDASLLIHPVAGVSKPGDLAYYSRVHCYQAIQHYFPQVNVMLSLLPIAMRMAGPREAIHNMIVRQNYGCTHFLVGPEHASPPGLRSGAKRFYERYAAQKRVEQVQDQLAIQMVSVPEMGYSKSAHCYVPCSTLVNASDLETYNEKNLDNALEHDQPVPDWYSYPEVIAELAKIKLSRRHKGFVLFFTGLSGSGKSTLAKLMYAFFIERGGRPVSLLDGDVVRTHLSSELGFSKEHRDLNVKRIGYVASEIAKNRGIAICAPIAPYKDIRRQVRDMIESVGAFIEIHVATPLEICEQRDRKGLYAKARKGLIKNFTGISDPYEIPEHAEIRIDTSTLSPSDAAARIQDFLRREKYI